MRASKFDQPHLTSLDVFENRIFQRLTLLELFSLALCIGLVFVFAWYQSQGKAFSYDYNTYLWAGSGDLRVHYYAFWILPIFKGLTAVSPVVGFIIWNLANIAGVFAASRILGGTNKAPFALLTYQMFYTLYYGNIIGVLLGGLALYWWGLTHRRWYIAGIGLIIALTKYQIGAPFGLIFLLSVNIPWRNRLRVLVVPTIVLCLSLIIYPLWPVKSIQIILSNPPNSLGSISLWHWLGPFALILWLPPIFIPLPTKSRMIALSVAVVLTSPYFQQSDLLTLFVLPVGYLSLMGNLGFFLFVQNGWEAISMLFVVPVVMYLGIFSPLLFSWLRGYMSH